MIFWSPPHHAPSGNCTSSRCATLIHVISASTVSLPSAAVSRSLEFYHHSLSLPHPPGTARAHDSCLFTRSSVPLRSACSVRIACVTGTPPLIPFTSHERRSVEASHRLAVVLSSFRLGALTEYVGVQLFLSYLVQGIFAHTLSFCSYLLCGVFLALWRAVPSCLKNTLILRSPVLSIHWHWMRGLHPSRRSHALHALPMDVPFYVLVLYVIDVASRAGFIGFPPRYLSDYSTLPAIASPVCMPYFFTVVVLRYRVFNSHRSELLPIISLGFTAGASSQPRACTDFV